MREIVTKIDQARSELSPAKFSALELRKMLIAINYPTSQFDAQLRDASPKYQHLETEVAELRLKKQQAQHALKLRKKMDKGIHSRVQRSKVKARTRTRTPSPGRTPRPPSRARSYREEEEEQKQGSPPRPAKPARSRRGRGKVDVSSGDGPYKRRRGSR